MENEPGDGLKWGKTSGNGSILRPAWPKKVGEYNKGWMWIHTYEALVRSGHWRLKGLWDHFCKQSSYCD